VIALDIFRDISKIADTTARNLPVTGQQLLLIAGGFIALILVLLLLVLLQRIRKGAKNKKSPDNNDNVYLLIHSLEELALDAEALEELYQNRLISAELFLEEATAFKRQADLLQRHLLREK